VWGTGERRENVGLVTGRSKTRTGKKEKLEEKKTQRALRIKSGFTKSSCGERAHKERGSSAKSPTLGEFFEAKAAEKTFFGVSSVKRSPGRYEKPRRRKGKGGKRILFQGKLGRMTKEKKKGRSREDKWTH